MTSQTSGGSRSETNSTTAPSTIAKLTVARASSPCYPHGQDGHATKTIRMAVPRKITLGLS
ncbi:MAG: hypothetical protein ACRC8S_19935 [Fimbriiglobus sp.]